MAIDRTRNRLEATTDSRGRVVRRWRSVGATPVPTAAVIATPPPAAPRSSETVVPAERPPLPYGFVDLFHRTSRESADAIYRGESFTSRESGDTAWFSTFDGSEEDAAASGYGEGLVWVRVPVHGLVLDDEFPSGEEHYQVRVGSVTEGALLGREGFEGPSAPVDEDPAPRELADLVARLTERADDVEFAGTRDWDSEFDDDSLGEWEDEEDDEEGFVLADASSPATAAGNCHSASVAVAAELAGDLPEGSSASVFSVEFASGSHAAVLLEHPDGEYVVDYTMRQFGHGFPYPFLGSRENWEARLSEVVGDLTEVGRG